MIEIQYTVDEEDLVAFNEFHSAHSPTFRRAMLRNRVVLPAVLFVLAGVSWWLELDPFFAVYCLVVAAILVLFWPRYVRFWRRRQIRRLYGEGRNQGLFGEQVLRADLDGLHNDSAQGSTRCVWSAIERVGETPQHAFIYTSAVAGFIVSRAKLTRGSIEPFLEEVQRHATTAARTSERREGN